MDKMKELRLSQNVVIKSVADVNATTLTIKGKASVYQNQDGFLQIDRDKELMNLDFMDLESFKKNPILVVAHQWDRPIGKVTSIENINGALEVTAEVYKLTGEENIFEAVQLGLLKSFSISVVPHDFIYRDTVDGEILEIASSTLVEVSLMPVQSNQEALFDVISSKGVNHLSIDKQVLAKQNGMTCDELDGSCAFKSELLEKGVTMIEKEVKPEATPEVKPEATPEVKPEATPEVKPEATPEVKPEVTPEVKPEAPVFDETALVAAVAKVEVEKERLAKEKAEADQRAADEEAAQKAAEHLARIASAKEYIIERQKEILAIPDEDFDPDEVEDFYELVSDASEAIESKIQSIIKAQTEK